MSIWTDTRVSELMQRVKTLEEKAAHLEHELESLRPQPQPIAERQLRAADARPRHPSR